MQDFRRLAVGQQAHQLVLAVYRTTSAFPKAEQYGLISQLRRAVVSIASNIVEGSAQHNDREMARFLRFALASAAEVEYQLLLSRDPSYLPASEHDALSRETVSVKRMLNAIISKLRRAANGYRTMANSQRTTAND